MKIELEHIKPETASADEKWRVHISGKEFYSICKITEVEYNAFMYLQSQLKEVSTLNDSFPGGLGDYEWKIIENFNSKNFRITELEDENKKLKEASAILNSLSEEKPCPACSNKLDYKPRIYYCGHCGSDFN